MAVSVNIKQSNGILKKIAGNTILLDATCSEIRSGTFSIQCVGNSGANTSITFETPMSDTDYVVIFESNSPAAGEVGFRNKTTTGFGLYVLGGRGDTEVYTFTGKYYAFRLVELEGYNAIYNKMTNIDTSPTENSTNLVTSGGVYDAISSASKIFVNSESAWNELDAETKATYQVAIFTDKPNVNAVDSTDGSTTVVGEPNKRWFGTAEEWEQFKTDHPDKVTEYDIVCISNDMDTGEVVNAVTDGDMRAVTSNAVYDALTNTTIIQSDVKRSVTQDPTQSTWYSAYLPKPTIPTGKRLVRWLAFTDSSVMAASVCGYNGDVDNCILVIGDIMHEATPLTFNIWWGAEVADC